MIRAGKSQQDVAAQLGVSQPAVSRRLAGYVDFSASELESLADLFNVPVAAFFTPATALAEGKAS